MKEVPTLDLHGVTHEDAPLVVEEWVLMWDYRVQGFTGKIITGNSTKMKTIVFGVLRKHHFNFVLNWYDGSIIVTGKL
jgi:hypothetical protein